MEVIVLASIAGGAVIGVIGFLIWFFLIRSREPVRSIGLRQAVGTRYVITPPTNAPNADRAQGEVSLNNPAQKMGFLVGPGGSSVLVPLSTPYSDQIPTTLGTLQRRQRSFSNNEENTNNASAFSSSSSSVPVVLLAARPSRKARRARRARKARKQ